MGVWIVVCTLWCVLNIGLRWALPTYQSTESENIALSNEIPDPLGKLETGKSGMTDEARDWQ